VSYLEAKIDGTTEVGSGYTSYDVFSVFVPFLNQNTWSFSEIERKSNLLIGRLLNQGFDLELYIYLNKVTPPGRPLFHEKRIQLNQRIPRDGFDLTETNTRKVLLLGIYKRDTYDDTVICAFHPDEWDNRGSQKSCQVRIEIIAKALRDGFSQGQSKHDQIICAFRPEFLFFYMLNRDYLHKHLLSESVAGEYTPPPGVSEDRIPYNKIIYGAPGTGKSYELNEQAKSHFAMSNILRVTFHPSYSYGHFIGSYKPKPLYKDLVKEAPDIYDTDKRSRLEGDEKKEPIIDYSFSPGPLIELLIRAIRNPGEKFLLIIEEINRANVASVFGDTFQLLDRNNETGESEYSITFNPDVSNYLRQNDIDDQGVRLPKNLYIWATMNSADQGVLPIDTAFKRRWLFEYLPLDEKAHHMDGKLIKFQGNSYKYNEFRNSINDSLKQIGIPEDRLIGPFFLSKDELDNPSIIKNKLLLYLRDDILRHSPEKLFKSKIFSDIVKDYDEGREVFTFPLPPPILVASTLIDEAEGNESGAT